MTSTSCDDKNAKAMRLARRPLRLLLPFLTILALPWGAPSHASVVPYLGLAEMEQEGEVIVLGTVEAADAGMSDDGRLIVTRVTVTVERSLKGGPRARVSLEVPGGTLNGETLVASGAPTFRKGERVVLFLGRGGTPGASLGVVGWNQGRFVVERDAQTKRELVRQPGGDSVYLERQGRAAQRDPQISGPRVLQDFLNEIDRLVKARAKAGAGAGSASGMRP